MFSLYIRDYNKLNTSEFEKTILGRKPFIFHGKQISTTPDVYKYIIYFRFWSFTCQNSENMSYDIGVHLISINHIIDSTNFIRLEQNNTNHYNKLTEVMIDNLLSLGIPREPAYIILQYLGYNYLQRLITFEQLEQVIEDTKYDFLNLHEFENNDDWYKEHQRKCISVKKNF